ncbi:MAG TPA: EAL domain-containing protein, partial [Telmatospirillum sp.]|nr:EAL domain-containing protein [Telmatospirillum sp.]
RVVIPMAAALTLLVAGMSGAGAWWSMRDARNNLALRAKLTASMLSHGIAPLAWSVDWDAAQRVLASLRADPDYAGSIIWDDLGDIVARDGSADRDAGDIVQGIADIDYMEESGETHRVGRVSVRLQTDRAEVEMMQRLSEIAFGGLGVLLAICGILVYIVRGFIRPINALTATMTGLAGGDTELSVPALDRRDEIGHMAVATETFKQNAIALRASETRYRELQENLMEGVYQVTPEGRLLSTNQAMADILGWDSPVEMLAALIDVGKQLYVDPARGAQLAQTVRENGFVRGFEIQFRRKDGTEITALLSARGVVADGDLIRLDGTLVDITERKRAEAKIQDLAFFDQLTGLPNRTLLLDRMRQAMMASSRSGGHGGLLFIDLDNFKTLNDTLGHDMGDLLLKQVAQRLSTCVRAGDTVARLGGDEFLLMLEGLSANMTDAAAHIETIGEKIITILNKPFQIQNAPFHCTPSIGVTLFQGQVASVDDLLKQADLAMYKAKAAGRNTIRFFDPGMAAVVMKRASLEADLREAVQKNQFLLHYQPQVVGSGLVTGAEALVRWQHPQRGMVSPAEFIPLAEETGLILPLGEWVMETACTQLALWANNPVMAHLTVAVNVSARQFHQADFVDQVLAALKKTETNPLRLKLELTESLLVENVQDIIEKMFALKAKGIGFSLDDFGTGYSSLSYLKRLPLDQLKIDQSFVRDVLVDPNDAAIAKTVVALAQSLGLGVIAEGVETMEQRDFLAIAGCHTYQGYFFSRPLPLESFEQFVGRV